MRLFGHLLLILIVSLYRNFSAKRRLLSEIEIQSSPQSSAIFAAGTYLGRYGRYIAQEIKNLEPPAPAAANADDH